MNNKRYFVVHNSTGEYMVIDPSCGYPAFDIELCGRTTHFDSEADADQYIKNLDGGYGKLTTQEITI